MSKVGIVTVLYNGESMLDEFFESLENQSFKDFTLYIIDNKSTDNSLSKARALAQRMSFPSVFYAEEQNWGVAKGNNIGIRAALADKCEYVLLSNNDVVLNNTDTLEIMVNKMDQTDIDILCPKIYYYYDKSVIWAAGGTYRKNDTGTYHYGRDQKDEGQCEEERSIRYTPTCFVIIRADVFNKIGMMDEWYFVYYDDTDFMYRAWKAGLKMVYTPATSIWHNESVSTGPGSPFKHYYLARNHLYFVRKNRSLNVYASVVGYRYLAFTAKHMWTRKKELVRAEWKGLRDGLKASLFGINK